MSEDLKKLQIKFKAALTLFTILVVCGFFIFSLFYLKEAALALQGNYNKIPATEGQLTIQEWNYLDEDFLNKEGDTWLGPNPLNMGGNSIANVATNPLNSTDAANVQYVLDAIAAGGAAAGGDVFTVWGESGEFACGSATKLYSGHGFSANYGSTGGGPNPICLQSGDAGPYFVSQETDIIFPLVTSLDSGDLPTDIAANRIVRCAVCHNSAGTCYEGYGSDDCNNGEGGFSAVYDGFVLGGNSGAASHFNPTKRACVSSNFDGGDSAGMTVGNLRGAIWYGARVNSDFGLGLYTPNAFVKCAVCCN